MKVVNVITTLLLGCIKSETNERRDIFTYWYVLICLILLHSILIAVHKKLF